jgi:AcrR family transcriptional regulator
MPAADAVVRERVRQLIDARPGTKREFAVRVGLEPTKLSKSLHGKRRFTAAELAAVAAAGGVSLEWLLYGNGAGPEEPSPAEQTGAGSPVGDEARRRDFLEAAWKLISERGYHAVRIADIAHACGTSSGAVHYYFPGKQDVLSAALHYCVEQAFARQSSELKAIDDARERMLKLIEEQLPRPGQVRQEWSIWLQFWSEAALRAELRPIHNNFYARWRDTVIRIVRRGQRQGVFRDVDAEDFALRYTALTDGLGVQVLTEAPGVTVDRMRQALLDFVDRELVLPDSQKPG